jgi:hypothetical protein
MDANAWYPRRNVAAITSGSAVQTNGLGLLLWSSTKLLIASCGATGEGNVPRRRRRLVSLATKVSTASSQIAVSEFARAPETTPLQRLSAARAFADGL